MAADNLKAAAHPLWCIRWLPYSSLGWCAVFLILNPCGYYMQHQFDIQQMYVLSTHCIYVFFVDLRTNNDYFPILH